MATETITAYESNVATSVFVLAQTGATKTEWRKTGRALALPYSLSVERKIGNSNSPSNDHIVLRVSRVEANATTSKLATFQVSLDISIPKDQTVLTPAEQKKALSIIASILNEGTAMEATNANITKLIEGRDL